MEINAAPQNMLCNQKIPGTRPIMALPCKPPVLPFAKFKNGKHEENSDKYIDFCQQKIRQTIESGVPFIAKINKQVVVWGVKSSGSEFPSTFVAIIRFSAEKKKKVRWAILANRSINCIQLNHRTACPVNSPLNRTVFTLFEKVNDFE